MAKSTSSSSGSKRKTSSSAASAKADPAKSGDDALANAVTGAGEDAAREIAEAPETVAAGDDTLAAEPAAPEVAPADDTQAATADEITLSEPGRDATPEAEAAPEPKPEPEPAFEPEPVAEPVTASAPPPPPPPTREVVVEKRGGVVPLVIGGVIAAGLGFAAGQYGLSGNSDALAARLDEQAATLATLSDGVSAAQSSADAAAATAAAIDLAPVSDRIEAGLGAVTATQETLTAGFAATSGRLDALDTTLAALDERLTGLGARMTDLEKRPIEDNVSREAIAAYERELALLQDAMAAERAQLQEAVAAERASIEALMESQKAEMERIAAEASQMEERAIAEAQAAARREALARVQAALDAGTPFGTAVADLSQVGAEVPGALEQVAGDGIATQAALAQSFPDVARAALAAARRASPEETGGGIGGFLKTQLGVRSVVPQEGSSADAVLSRAEAAVLDGRLADALTELDALPEAAQAAIAEWRASAEARIAAIDAARALSQSLN